jgi:glutathione S-transferase
MVRIYTFTISHFSEKVRWALDYEGIEYTERRLLPGAHIPIVRWSAPKQSVPVLFHDDVVVQGSSTILDYVQNTLNASKLTPPTEALALQSAKLEALADHALGLGVQRIVYQELLSDKPAIVDVWTQQGPSWGPLFCNIAFPIMAYKIRQMYGVTPEGVASAKETFRRAFEQLDQILAKRRYLILDDAPTRADITVAALLAPLCMPPEHTVRWPKITDEAMAVFREFEGRPTWELVLRMYREHRKPKPKSSSP